MNNITVIRYILKDQKTIPGYKIHIFLKPSFSTQKQTTLFIITIVNRAEDIQK